MHRSDAALWLQARGGRSQATMRGLVAALVVTGLALAAPLATPAAACSVPPQAFADVTYMGLTLATVDAQGQWSGRWIGAHPFSCEQGEYTASVAGQAWSLVRAAAESGNDFYMLGDVPYAGDSACIVGTLRRWWTRAAVDAAGERLTWQPVAIPSGAPSLECPTNANADAPLVLRFLAITR